MHGIGTFLSYSPEKPETRVRMVTDILLFLGLSCALETCLRVLVVLKLFVALLYSKRYELFVVFSKYLMNIKFSQELLNKIKY